MYPQLDKRSFVLGMVTAFSECVANGCKRLAFSPPLSAEDFASVSRDAEEIVEKHGLLHYHEKNPDLPGDRRPEWLLIAGQQDTIDRYLALRAKGLSPLESLAPFYELLSYDPAQSVRTGYDAYRELFPPETGGARVPE